MICASPRSPFLPVRDPPEAGRKRAGDRGETPEGRTLPERCVRRLSRSCRLGAPPHSVSLPRGERTAALCIVPAFDLPFPSRLRRASCGERAGDRGPAPG